MIPVKENANIFLLVKTMGKNKLNLQYLQTK